MHYTSTPLDAILRDSTKLVYGQRQMTVAAFCLDRMLDNSLVE